jgi:uncharacterized protein DUF2442
MATRKNSHRSVKFTRTEMEHDLPDEIDFANVIPIIGRGVFAEEFEGAKAARVQFVLVGDDAVAFTLEDGRHLSAPLSWYPRLKHASPSERNDWRIILDGRAVVWESVRIGIAVRALLNGERSNESAAELRKWLDARKRTKVRKTA